MSFLGFVSTSDFFRAFLLRKIQSSVPTLIGSSVQIFKERVTFRATRIEILHDSIPFCKAETKYFCLHLESLENQVFVLEMRTQNAASWYETLLGCAVAVALVAIGVTFALKGVKWQKTKTKE